MNNFVGKIRGKNTAPIFVNFLTVLQIFPQNFGVWSQFYEVDIANVLLLPGLTLFC